MAKQVYPAVSGSAIIKNYTREKQGIKLKLNLELAADEARSILDEFIISEEEVEVTIQAKQGRLPAC